MMEISKRLNKLIVLLCIAIGVPACLSIIMPEYRSSQKLRARLAELEEINLKKENYLHKLTEDQKRLVKDLSFARRTAHDAGLVADNEFFVQFMDQ